VPRGRGCSSRPRNELGLGFGFGVSSQVLGRLQRVATQTRVVVDEIRGGLQIERSAVVVECVAHGSGVGRHQQRAQVRAIRRQPELAAHPVPRRRRSRCGARRSRWRSRHRHPVPVALATRSKRSRDDPGGGRQLPTIATYRSRTLFTTVARYRTGCRRSVARRAPSSLLPRWTVHRGGARSYVSASNSEPSGHSIETGTQR
jgi:hypothetical protein